MSLLVHGACGIVPGVEMEITRGGIHYSYACE